MISLLLAMITLLAFGGLLANRASQPFAFPPPSDPYPGVSVLAWMSGGARRAAQAWWSELSHAGLMVASADGKTYSRAARIPPREMDPWMMQALAQVGQGKTAHEVLLAWQKPLASLRGHMEHSGWVAPHADYDARKNALLLFGAAGLVLCGAGMWWGGWGFAAILVFMETVGLFAWALSRIPERLSPAAQSHLAQVRRSHQHAVLAPQADQVGLAVALGGAGAIIGTPFESHASPAARKENSASGCGSGGCSPVMVSWGSDSNGGEGGSGCDSSGGGCGGGGCGGGD